MKTLISTTALIILFTCNALAQNTSAKCNQISVSTEQEDGSTYVTWESYKEVNSSYFLLEKSENGGEFKTIHSQLASGSTHSKKSYTYEDTSSNGGMAEYRVVTVFMDGGRMACRTPLSDSTFIVSQD
jgi:hypothetical protein